MLAIIPAAVLGLPQADYGKDVSQFKAAFAARRSDVPGNTPDPAISRALDLLVRAIKRAAIERPTSDEEDVPLWVAPYREAIIKKSNAPYGPLPDEYESCDALLYKYPKFRFIVARMGAVTRTVAYDDQWRNIALPKEFSWSTPWYPEPRVLPCGLWLMDGSSIQAAGNRVGLRLVWLKPEGLRAHKVGEFEHEVVLDFSSAKISGNKVTARVVDDPRTFYVSAATNAPERVLTWDCSSGRPKLVCEELEHQELRAIDRAVLMAWHARAPTKLQRGLRTAWPRREMLNDWSVERTRGGVTRVHFENLVFGLRRMGIHFEVVSVGKLSR